MRSREERMADRLAKAEERRARREYRRDYNQAVREEIKESNIRHRAAMHLDFIDWQNKRAYNTACWFPNIARSHTYQEYVNRNINRNARIYNYLMSTLED